MMNDDKTKSDFIAAASAPQQAFDDWFGNSVITDDAGAPLVVFHGTSTIFDPHDIYPLSHFGSAKSAHYRIRDVGSPVLYPVLLRMENPLHIPDLTVHSKGAYYRLLSMQLEWGAERNIPKRILSSETVKHCFADKDYHHRAERANRNLFYHLAGNFMPNARKEDIEAEAYRQTREKEKMLEELEASDILHPDQKIEENLWIDRMVRALENAGYDGFIYENRVEDRGSTSYIPFRASQVRSLYASDQINVNKYLAQSDRKWSASMNFGMP
ncbi:MAG: hypothetical protein ACQEQL_05420 [Pseudomonadota bacterium]